MRAIDTNILVRFLVADEPLQTARARSAIEGGEVFASTTVVLECEWVLRSAYGFSADRIAAALRAFAGLPSVTLQEPALLFQSLEWMARGMDLADALHLGRAQGCAAFLSFDRRLARTAAGLSRIPVLEP